MKKLFLILTALSSTSQSLAGQSVLLISPLIQLEQRDLPLELNKSYKIFSDYYLENFPKEKNVDNLLNEFESAQKYYLVKSFDLARQHYENVVAYSDVDEWKDVQRKIIYLSYIRLSELSKHNQQDWILQALSFSLETDPLKLGIEKNSLKKINETKKLFLKESIIWQVSQFKSDFKYILVNGHTIDLKKIETVKIPSGKFRVTFLSDVYKPQTYQVSSQQIPLITPTRLPFVSGSCEKPYVNNEGEVLGDVAVYYSQVCIKNLVNKKWTDVGNRNEPVSNFIPANESPSMGFSSTAFVEDPFYKKPWFLVSLGILGTAAAIYAIDKNGEKKTTHETVNGF